MTMMTESSIRRNSKTINTNSSSSNNSYKNRWSGLLSHLTFAVVFHVVCIAWMPSLYPCLPYDHEESSYDRPWFAALQLQPLEQGRRKMLLTEQDETSQSSTPHLRVGQPASTINATQLRPPQAITTTSSNKLQVPPTLQKIVAGMGRVNRDDFARAFDTGIPLQPSAPGNEDVLLLYQHPTSLPPSYNTSQADSSRSIPLLSTPEDATRNCISMKLVLMEPEETHSCLAIMGNWQSHHVHKWMRVTPSTPGVPASLEQPLHMSSRRTTRANYRVTLPTLAQTKEAALFYSHYMTRLDDTLDKIRPLAKAVAQGKLLNTVIVMVSNHGQSEMFINFVCSARSRGLDLSQVLLFATDIETKELGDSLGITTFYDEHLFGELPKTAAAHYFDPTFAKMVLAKVYSAHLVNMLQYNVLLQDVDVVWYRNPLEFFSSPSLDPNFDMYFQDNGSRTFVYEAFEANTGFYFAKYNNRTSYYFSSLIRHADLILQSGDDQNAMNALLNDHASFTGLRVKTLHRDLDSFPGGYHFHRSPEQMKDMISGKTLPYLFHMSWTKHKVEKRQFLEQMGDFRVSNQCIGKTAAEIVQTSASHDVAASCCMAEPVIKCHYRDKPSRVPCKDSPPYEEGRPSFW